MNELIPNQHRQFIDGRWAPWGFTTKGNFIPPTQNSNRYYPESFQGTGFQDSKLVEIFRGDIIEGGTGKRAVVEWNDNHGQWWSVPIDTTPNCPLHEEDCIGSITVIGSETTHPELIGEDVE